MTRRTAVTLTSNGNVLIGQLGLPEGIIHTTTALSGFSGGTLTMFLSFDGGVTQEAFLDGTTPYSKTTTDMFRYRLPFTDNGGLGVKLYATLADAGATPSVSVQILDEM